MGRSVTIDLVTQRPDGAFVLVLVEEGAWASDVVHSELRRLQDRLWDAVEAAIDGHLVSQYPDAMGQAVIIRLNCYDVPRQPVEEFFLRFSDHIRTRADVDADLRGKGFVASLDFEFNWRRLTDA
jgi:hypothetical protein